MLKIALPRDWTLQAVGDLSEVPLQIKNKIIPATVPGCVHTDLMAAGLIEDPYLERNELQVAWIGRTDWKYSCKFTIESGVRSHERVDLVCDGLDTVATIELNGKPIAQTANMHMQHRFDAKTFLREGENELAITFASALKYAEALEAKFGALPHVEKHPFNFIRKMACNFGWDWGPALITAGIWREIRLEGWSTARIVSVKPLIVNVDSMSATFDILVDVERLTEDPLTVIGGVNTAQGRTDQYYITFKYGEVDAKGQTTVRFKIDDPKLWWPRGHGEQALYPIDVGLYCSRDWGVDSPDMNQRWLKSRLGHEAIRIGLRTVKLNTDKDDIGSKFQIEVNGKPIFCKGANWIPDDCFPHRVTKERYRQRIQQAADANMNMLRVWGGGIYESDEFYSICDEMGIMVWQDFLFACAAYPEEEPYKSNIKAEARYNIARLSPHPSLVIWNGCNENIWGYFDWGWKQKLKLQDGENARQGDGEISETAAPPIQNPLSKMSKIQNERTWGLGYYLDFLPKLMHELDPTRPYWPASPYSGSMDIHPLDDKHGNKHIWDAWNQKDYTVYRNYKPRFCSEFGHQAPPTYATLRSAIPARQLEPASKAMLHHQKAQGGNDKLHARLAEHFEIPKNFDDWLYLTQLNQARAIQCGVEWFRTRTAGVPPVSSTESGGTPAVQRACMGALYWQLNDCWPVTSWSAVDSEGRPKPLWYATRRFFADRLLTIQEEVKADDHQLLGGLAINDSDELWRGEVVTRRVDFFGREWSRSRAELDLAPRSIGRIKYRFVGGGYAWEERLPLEAIFNLHIQFLIAECGPHRAFWYFDIDKNLAYPEPQFDSELKIEGDTYNVTVTAKTFLRDICLFVDRLDPSAVVNDQLITLLPGESFTFTFKSQRQLSKEAILTPPVFQCANRFGREHS